MRNKARPLLAKLNKAVGKKNVDFSVATDIIIGPSKAQAAKE